VTDDCLKIPNENMYVIGDCTGKFRGIVASMVSGAFVTQKIMQDTKQTVILLSGKRFNGKGESASILKNYYESKGKSVHVLCCSYFLKQQFCEINKLDFERFIKDHAYKDSFRDELTIYLDTCEYVSFTKMLEHSIDNDIFGKFDVYIVDDIRCLEAQINYIKDNCSDKWNTYSIRINSLDSSRKSRGWIRTSYDDHMCENDLDHYHGFDSYIDNDFTIDELREKIFSCKLPMS
jgi:phosphomevalonate kinase